MKRGTVTLGYHASHEQWSPRRLLDLCARAEAAGFDAGMCSDHFAPWSPSQGESGYAWSWLGAALQATGMPFGVVTAPGYRYHPAVVAQGIATLGSLFPGRFWAALGSGEALNESITGDHWPDKAARQERLAECAAVIRRLLDGETVHTGEHVRVQGAKIWSRPDVAPPLFIAALSPETAAMHARWADGLITVNAERNRLAEILDAFRRHGGEGKPAVLQIHVSFAGSMAEASELAYVHWRSAVLPGELGQNLPDPWAFENAMASVTMDDVAAAVRISDDPEQHAAWLAEDVAMGFERLYLHQVGPNQEAFIDAFGATVLPMVRRAVRSS